MITPDVSKIKILHVIATMDLTLGGPIQGVRNYANELCRLSVNNEVACLDAPGKEDDKSDLFTIHRLGPAKTSWNYSDKLRPWLKQNLQRFDVVVIHGLWLYNGYAVIKEIEKLKRQKNNGSGVPKVFVMPHGMLDPYFQKAEGRKLKAIRNILYWKYIESKVVNGADGLLFTCEEELLLARKTFGNYKPKQESNILFGITDPPCFTASMQSVFLNQYPQLASGSYLLFLSRIHEKKGLDLLIQAYAEVYGNNTGTESEPPGLPLLVIAGPGADTPYGNALREMVKKLHLDKLVLFPGMLTGNAKWGAFYGCESFVLPSHQENFGIAVAEALACAKPVLISKQINIWREIDGCEAGLMEDDTLEGTKRLLLNWKNLSPERKGIMAKNARECYRSNFSIAPAALRMLAVFNAAVEKNL